MFVPAAFAELETETSVGERAHFLGGIGFLHVTEQGLTINPVFDVISVSEDFRDV
jgi:hypothetical protein